METFEFVVTSIARVALKEHVKIQAEGVEDAITRIKDKRVLIICRGIQGSGKKLTSINVVY